MIAFTSKTYQYQYQFILFLKLLNTHFQLGNIAPETHPCHYLEEEGCQIQAGNSGKKFSHSISRLSPT